MARRKKKCCSFTEILSLLEHLGKLYDFALGKVNFCPPLRGGGKKSSMGGAKLANGGGADKHSSIDIILL